MCSSRQLLLKGLASGEGYAAGRMDAAWGLAPLDTAGMGWQTLQSIYAHLTGGMFGVGIGASVQKHQWLPYAENDFIFGVIGEELGFFGCVILIGAFAVLLIMGVMIALRAPTCTARCWASASSRRSPGRCFCISPSARH